MILLSNIPEVTRRSIESEKVLDVGGWWCPFNPATHVIDLSPYKTRRVHDTLMPEQPERFTEQTWTIHDVCEEPWPYPDKFFDFSFCSHLLEDDDDPAAVCRELVRTCKSGYIEPPSKLRETFSKDRFFWIKSLFGKATIGFSHHKWFCGLDDSHWTFAPKNTDEYVTRSQMGRKLTEEESGIFLFWDDRFSFRSTLNSANQTQSGCHKNP